jgi:hypothetical protein
MAFSATFLEEEPWRFLKMEYPATARTARISSMAITVNKIFFLMLRTMLL